MFKRILAGLIVLLTAASLHAEPLVGTLKPINRIGDGNSYLEIIGDRFTVVIQNVEVLWGDRNGVQWKEWTEPPPPPVPVPALWVSTLPDRSNPVKLDGATVSGSIYAFLLPEDDIDKVEFFVNGKLTQTEGVKPFDLAGSADPSRAEPFDTTNLGAGEQSINARITKSDGSIDSATAKFTVTIPADCGGVIPNGCFSEWVNDNPVQWSMWPAENANQYLSKSTQGLRFFWKKVESTPTFRATVDAVVLKTGVTYNWEVVIPSYTSGYIRLFESNGGMITGTKLAAAGTHKGTWTAKTDSKLTIFAPYATDATDADNTDLVISRVRFTEAGQ